jgi:hypothetical protein
MKPRAGQTRGAARPVSTIRSSAADDPLRARRRRAPVRLAQGGPCAGLDIGGHRSDHRARVGKLARQGSPQLRWAPFEAAQSACRPQSPDHADYLALKARGLSHVRASMTNARNRPALVPHPARARPQRARPRQLILDRRPLPPSPPIEDDSQASGQLPQRLRFPPPGGGPPKTERPESIPPDRPINHHVAGHQAADPDKAGRPQSDRTNRSRHTP